MSCEGVTQGDHLAMAFYALATIPLIEKLKQNVLQIWYADDAAGGGKICSFDPGGIKLETWALCLDTSPMLQNLIC